MRAVRNATLLGDLVALVVLVGALLLPDRLTRTDLGSFAAVPVELVLGGALLLVLPARARRPVATILGLALGALTVLKIVDVGFYGALARPFDLVLDWTLLPGAWELLHSSLGGTVAVLVVAAAGLVVVAVLVGTAWACRRLARLLDGHPSRRPPGARRSGRPLDHLRRHGHPRRAAVPGGVGLEHDQDHR